MNTKTWSLQDAKNRFSAVVDAALTGSAQFVNRRGRAAVVVVSADEYERLRRAERGEAASLGDLLLAMPQDDGEFERPGLKPRDAKF